MTVNTQAKMLLEKYLARVPDISLPFIAEKLGMDKIRLRKLCTEIYGKVNWRRLQLDRYNADARERNKFLKKVPENKEQIQALLERYLNGEKGITLNGIARECKLKQMQLVLFYKSLYTAEGWRRLVDERNNKIASEKRAVLNGN